MNSKNNLETGLIKEALLVSVALFLLVKSGFDIEQLLEPEFWRQFIEYAGDVLMKIFENIKAVFS